MATKSIVANLELGHRAIVKHQKTSEGFTHDWEVFVQGVGGAHIEHYVEKVVFYLHESFSNPQRVIKSPPYHVREKGYGGFILPIEVYFKATDEHRKTKINYDLFLQSVDSAPIHHTIIEKITFCKPKEELRKLLLLGGAIEETIPEDSKKSSQSSVSRPASGGKTKPRYDSNGASKLDQGDSHMRKSKDSIGKLDSNRRREKSKESSRVRQSSQKESSRSKESAKPKEPYVKEKESSKQKHKEQTSKSGEPSDKMKGAYAKQKDTHKPKEVKAPDAFSELFGEMIGKGDTQSASQHKSDKNQPKNPHKVHSQNPSDANPSKVGKSKNKTKAEKNIAKGQDKIKQKDYYKGPPEPVKEPSPSKSKAAKKAKKQLEIAKNQIVRDPPPPAPKTGKGKQGGQKAVKESVLAKPVVQQATIKPLSRKEKKRLRKKASLAPEPEVERKVPTTPPTPRKAVTSTELLYSSSGSSYSGSRSLSRSSEGSSGSRRGSGSPSRSLSRMGSSRSQSRSAYSGKSRSRSPPSVRTQKSLSKSPSAGPSRSDTAMSRSTSSSSCRGSLSVDAAQDTVSADQAGGQALGALNHNTEGNSTEGDDEKRFRSSDEEILPSPTKKSYKKRRNSEMVPLPSSRHSSCHSGKGASSSSENEKAEVVDKQLANRERKRMKKQAAKLRRRMAKVEAAAAAAVVAADEGGIPSTPGGGCDSDKSDMEMAASLPRETFSEQAQRENAELFERCRQLVIAENYTAINEIMRIVGRSHSMQKGYISIDYYKLSKISRMRLRNYMDKVDPPD